MRLVAAMLLMTMLMLRGAVAQPADCPVEPSEGSTLPLKLDLAGRTGVPPGTTGQAYIAVPMTPPGYACEDTAPPPKDVLHGEPGDVLHGPGTPHVEVQVR
jgi:hypothetical protein